MNLPSTDQLFGILSNPDAALELMNKMIERDRKSSEDSPVESDIDQWCHEAYESWLKRVAKLHIEKIFKHCESPIEQAFWTSLHIHFLRNEGLALVIQEPPAEDVEKAIKRVREHYEASLGWHIHYQSLPDDVRPESYEKFLSVLSSRQDCPLTHDLVPDMLQEAEFGYTFGEFFALRVVLQPAFQKFYSDGRGIRPDALIWNAANPRVKVVVECDGFDYHADREKFTSDRKRDRQLSQRGYAVRRYSGSEIVKNPAVCSGDLYDYLRKKFCYGFAYVPLWKKRFLNKGCNRVLTAPPSREVSFWNQFKASKQANTGGVL